MSKRRNRNQKAQVVNNPGVILRETARSERWTVPMDGTRARNQGELYRRLSWVWIAINHPSMLAATLTFNVRTRTGDKLEDIPNHPLELLLQRPNPLYTGFELKVDTFNNRRLRGNAYWWLNRSGPDATPTEIWPIPPQRIRPVPDERMFIKGYIFMADGGVEIPLEPWEIIHFKSWHDDDTFVGLSPVEPLATVALGDLAQQDWNTNFFHQDNAKPAGYLAFSDPIDDYTWEKLKADMKHQHGGTRRQLMMLRGAGAGGAKWVGTSLSQKDMDFLASREATKQEIFAIFAPGLASVLDVNATEANSVTGKQTLYELCIWPMLVEMSEKITTELLPAYGDNLVGEFDDPRAVNRELELKEQETASSVLTINELRSRFYELEPMDDERGDLLIKEIGSGRTNGQRHDQQADAQQAGVQPILGYHIESGVVTKNESRATVGLPPIDETEAEEQRRLKARLDVMKAARDAGLTVEAAALLAKVDLPQGMTIQDVTPQPAAVPVPQEQPQEPDMAPTKSDEAPDLLADLERYERKAIKALKSGRSAAVAFSSTAISAEQHAAIGQALESADTADQVRAAFAPIKAQVLTPDERALADATLAVLERYAPRAMRAILRGDTPDLSSLSPALRAAILPILTEQVLAYLDAQHALLGADVDPALEAADAAAWAARYTFTLVDGLTTTTQTLLQQAISTYADTPGMTRDALEALLRPAFGATRAEAIAVTEITRASAQASTFIQQRLADAGIQMERINNTNSDDRVCVICGPLHRKPESEWPSTDGPPWHPRCRCAVTLRKVRS